MPQALPHTDRIAQSTTLKKDYRTRVIELHDGYSRRMPDGINNVIWSGTINYEGLDSTTASAITSALDAVGGWDYLTFDPVDIAGQSNPLKFRVMAGYSVTYLSGVISNITFDIKQDF